jgi:hypothetical protein
MGTTYTFAPPMLGFSTADPWPAYAGLRVLGYVRGCSDQVAESRLLASSEGAARTRDVRAAFTPPAHPLPLYLQSFQSLA